MSKEYGRPPRAEENQALIAQRLEEASGSAGTGEKLTIEFRGTPVHLPVIHVPLGALYYNPATHRIRAQRAHDPAQDKLLEAGPWSPEGQAYLHRLLKARPDNPSVDDPEFGQLSESLRLYGQSDAGLITQDGVLVNGNTRRAALLELDGFGLTHEMRVAVLPSSTTWSDITQIELTLQLRDDHRREYTYINRLLAIEEQIMQGADPSVIAKTFRTTRATIDQDLWILHTLRELLERGGNEASPLQMMMFEDTKEKMRELHRTYMKELKSNPVQAELLKESRLAAVVLGFSKTDIRLIEPDFRDRYLARVAPDLVIEQSEHEPAEVKVPGIDITVKATPAPVLSAKHFTDTVLQARANEASTAGEVLSPSQTGPTLGELRESLNLALASAGKDARVLKRKQTAPNRLDGAIEAINQASSDLIEGRGNRTLDQDAFDAALLKLKASLERLAKETHRSFREPGAGVLWLLESFRKEN